ncbi:hypothetical protein KBZ18_14685 [Synechococcus sp. Cruz-9H2]|uniref:hypothetical protein n=1 Tax=unclassified Synechococcus TaxID=2626047 RepID=UPI0020CCEB32|nr:MULTISPECIES: hypothetical protein [unclassified Synechococcus]MCP9820729.1 hypothetical protein [Synechococcus sp. Cruz-9H2]MCP9845015.1 hypothetical protein [Synechococcus sp. Edmonson 11F2]MCP9857136.1 hypothetical protein [Synechococcus sp. Cruz-9C9]MCP9864421.1 hypothetical protein [Synechococcus sp. Cruz-7E5]MCP9871639.1 hypothetical protein [Synechococcus sp. Cruz-7B9]
MGRIADALRANLRDLAHADARALRALEAELQGDSPRGSLMSTSLPAPVSAPPVLEAGLETLGVKALRALCKERGFRGYSRWTRPRCLAALRSTADPSPVEHPELPGPELEDLNEGDRLLRLERRLDRLEGLLRLVAEQIGVPADRIERALGA